MCGEKENLFLMFKRIVLKDWVWVYLIYFFEIMNGKKLKNLMIDVILLMVDIDFENNVYGE